MSYKRTRDNLKEKTGIVVVSTSGEMKKVENWLLPEGLLATASDNPLEPSVLDTFRLRSCPLSGESRQSAQ